MNKIEGWFEWFNGESLIYTTERSWDRGNPYDSDVIPLKDFTENFANKKIRITIEEIE